MSAGDIPQDVMEAAIAVADSLFPTGQRAAFINAGPLYGPIASAILAERERCLSVSRVFAASSHVQTAAIASLIEAGIQNASGGSIPTLGRSEKVDGLSPKAVPLAATVACVISNSYRVAIFSSPDLAAEWAEKQDDDCAIVWPMVVDCPEFGNTEGAPND